MRGRQKIVEGARLYLRPTADGSGRVELFHEGRLEGLFTSEGEALAYAGEAILPEYHVGSASVHPGRPKKWVSAARRASVPDGEPT
jgi:hypothetical protein